VSNQPIFRGISVNKVIQAVDPATFTAVGPALISATLGQTVRVTIEVTVPDYVSLLQVVDPFPGALEPQDSNIYDTPSGQPQPLPWSSWIWWLPPVTTQYLPNKVIFIAGSLFPGTHTFSYVALVNGAGDFVVGPAYAYDVRQPEVSGLSAGGRFTTQKVDPTLINVGWDPTCFVWKDRELDPASMPDILRTPPSKITAPPTSESTSASGSIYPMIMLLVLCSALFVIFM